jgi:hypothetical protein
MKRVPRADVISQRQQPFSASSHRRSGSSRRAADIVDCGIHRPDAAGIVPGSSPGQAAGVDEGLEDGAELPGLDAHDPGAGVVFERLNPDMPRAVQ